MGTDGPTGGHGKWSTPGVPHKGWSCVNVEDRGDDKITCEMCETAEIRFAHKMQHPNYAGSLECGVVCAGNMEGDLARAAQRDKKLKSQASRRKAFPKRKGWHLNKNGNWQIKDGGFRVTMFQKGSLWRGVVAKLGFNQPGAFTRGNFEDLDAAKMAAFDTLSFLQDREPKRQLYNPADFF